MTRDEVTSHTCDDGIAAGRDFRTGDERKKRTPESDIRPTPQERQRVADDLRGIHRETMTVKHFTHHDELSPFADIINPTCRVGHYCDGLLECESCGSIFYEWVDGGKKPAYCPACGRRIEWRADQ